jgi:hypothetical protein
LKPVNSARCSNFFRLVCVLSVEWILPVSGIS